MRERIAGGDARLSLEGFPSSPPTSPTTASTPATPGHAAMAAAIGPPWRLPPAPPEGNGDTAVARGGAHHRDPRLPGRAPERGPGPSELARRLDLNKATAHSLLSALTDAGYLVRHPIRGTTPWGRR